MNLVSSLPIKRKKSPVLDRNIIFFIFHQDHIIWLTQRSDQDIWPQLFTFPFLEVKEISHKNSQLQLNQQIQVWTGLNIPVKLSLASKLKQLLSHQRIHGFFLPIQLPSHTSIPQDWIPVKYGDFSIYALPRILKTYIEKHGLP